jgi:hypothetical protein
MYRTAATKPASSSCGSVPVSNLCPSLGSRPHLVGTPALEQLGPRERDPEMRAEVLVRRADEDVGTDASDVDRAVRRVVHRVDPGQRAGRMGQLGDARDVDERAHRVRGPGEGDDARPVGELRLEVVEVEARVVADRGDPHLQVEVAREFQPRRDVAVVVELRDDDLVAGLELAPERAREREVERRHVRAEDDLFRRAAEEVAAGPARLVHERLRATARRVRAADVRVRGAQVVRDRLDHLVRHLRAAGPVEEDELVLERREPRPHRCHVESHRAHRTDGIRTIIASC